MATRKKTVRSDDARAGVEALWTRLPAFRAVAETENVHRAAAVLGTTPSAVSRTLRLLEAQLGVRLFERRGRSLALAPAGRQMLTSVRTSMRVVDDALADVRGAAPKGALRISCAGWLATHRLLPALRGLRLRHPAIVPHVTGLAMRPVAALLEGEIDFAMTTAPPVPSDGLEVARLGDAPSGVYCGAGHALYASAKVTPAEVLAHAFTAPEPRDGAAATDGWPADLARRVALYTSLLDVAVAACSSGELLLVLPDAVASTLSTAGPLRRLPVELVPPVPLLAIKRRGVTRRVQPADALLAELTRP